MFLSNASLVPVHLCVGSSVVPHQAAGLQGESGRLALLRWPSGGERRLGTAVRQGGQEAGLPVR